MVVEEAPPVPQIHHRVLPAVVQVGGREDRRDVIVVLVLGRARPEQRDVVVVRLAEAQRRRERPAGAALGLRRAGAEALLRVRPRAHERGENERRPKGPGHRLIPPIPNP